ncbi:MAG: glycosyltransferase family 9 protein [Acidobacteriota bacterium]|nr:glycosyltransferase family 9 protein [Acidobacteriota bacterium]
MRVLIVRIGAMGDVLHAMPAVAALRARHPDWFIGWAIEPRWSDLLQIAGDPEDLSQGVGPTARAMVDRWYRVAAGEWKKRPFSGATRSDISSLRKVFRADSFDLCVDMQGSLKSAFVGRMAGAPIVAGSDRPRERIARNLYRQRVEITAAHVVNQGCQLLGTAVGETLKPARVVLPMSAEAEYWADQGVGRERFCLISPSGGWGAKVWPPERLGRVAAELGNAGVPTVINASVHGSSDADAVAAASEGHARVVPCSISRLIALVRRAAVVIAGDTGPLHMAAALERPVVGIYGPTDPARNGPFGTRSHVFRDPASVTSHKRVHEPEAAMLRISVDEVVAAALEMLG